MTLWKSRGEDLGDGGGFDQEAVVAVGGLDLVVTGARDQFGEGAHILGREKLVRGHTDEGAVGLDLCKGGGDTSTATANVVAVNLVTNI